MASTDRSAATTRDLKSLISEQFGRLSAEAVARGEMSDEALRKLRQLAELEASLPKPAASRARRWPVILLCLGVFVVPGIMVSLKVPSVEVQINLLVTDLSWQQQQASRIIGRIALQRLSATSFDTIQLPGTRLEPAEKLSEPAAIFSIPKGGDGKIDLLPAHADANTRVWISMTPGEPHASLSMKGANMEVTANLSRRISIKSGGEQLGERDFGRPRPIKIEAAHPRLLDLALRFDGNPDITFPSHMMVSSLSLHREEVEVIDGLRAKRSVSSVLKGEIFNESMNGKRYGLRKGEWLVLDGVDGEIRSMRMTAEGIQLDYQGTATGIRVGSRQNRRSLMPNWLEWFGERHSVKMLWGAFLWLLSTLFGAIKWWQSTH